MSENSALEFFETPCVPWCIAHLAHKSGHGIARFRDSLLRSPREICELERRCPPVKRLMICNLCPERWFSLLDLPMRPTDGRTFFERVPPGSIVCGRPGVALGSGASIHLKSDARTHRNPKAPPTKAGTPREIYCRRLTLTDLDVDAVLGAPWVQEYP